MEKVLVIGSNGQLGTELVKTLTKQKIPFLGLDHSQIEVKNHEETRKRVERINPYILINTSAFHKVDLCEEQPEEAFEVNSLAVRNLAEICRDERIKLVHLSTDYVFDGNKKTPYIEDDLPNPLGVYGNSKLSGEYFVKNILNEHFIIRTSAIQGISKSSVKGSNFIETMLKLGREKGLVKVVDDQVITPTYAVDLAYKIIELASTKKFGTYHVTNEGELSWFDFAKKIFKGGGLDVQVEPISIRDASVLFNYKIDRPAYSALSSINLKNIGSKRMRNINDALNAYFEERENGI